MKLDQIALYVGVSKATVSRWESGEIVNMRRDRIAKLADILKLSPATLVGIEQQIKIYGGNKSLLISVLLHFWLFF